MPLQASTRTLPWYAVPWAVDGWHKIRRLPLVPLAILLFFLVIPAIFAPWVAPHEPFRSTSWEPTSSGATCSPASSTGRGFPSRCR
jgi:hypothetical protein